MSGQFTDDVGAPRGYPARTIIAPTDFGSERREFHERLWRTTITLGDVVVAGDGAAGELPANTTWFAIPCDADEHAQLERVLGHVEAVWQLDRDSIRAIRVEGPVVVARTLRAR